MILVTGGTGLVGAHILYELCQTEDRIKACKRASSDLYLISSIFEFYAPDNWKNLLSKIEWVNADLRDVYSLLDATKGVEIVYHAAAVVSFQKRDTEKMIENNIIGTANLVNACKSNGIRKIGHISSVAALGPAKNGQPMDENSHWEISTDNSNYAISKYGAEREVWRITEEGVDAVMVNPGIITGPGDWNNSSTAIFSTAKNNLKYYTLGSTAFVDVRDVSKAIIQLVNSDISSERYVLAAETVVWKDMFTMIANAFGVEPPTKQVTKGLAEIAWRVMKVVSWFSASPPKVTRETARSSLRTRVYSSKKIKTEFGFQFMPIEKSVNDTVNFLNKYYIDEA